METWPPDIGIAPYYSDDRVVIFNADSEAVLPLFGGDDVDVTMTSPPYNTLPTNHKPSGLHGERKSGVNQWIQRAADGYADQRPEPEYQDWLRGILGQCVRVSRGLVWVNHKVRYRDGAAVHPVRMFPWDIYAEVVWDRRCSMALNCKRFAPSHEGLWAFGQPHFWDDEQNTLMSVWDIGFDRGQDSHPCAYPLEIARRPIGSSCPEGGVVLDPFGGSCTTAVAAKQLGRRCICIELEERYCEIGAQRCRQGVLWQ